MPSPSASAQPGELRRVLEGAGWRCTPQREAIYEHLLNSIDEGTGHPSAEEVFRAVREEIPNISLATVYKALDALVACRLVSKLSADDGSARYDARRDEHYHLRDLRTGAVRDLPTPFDPDLVAKIDPSLGRTLAAEGFRVTGYRLELVGYFEGESRPPAEAV